MTLDYYCKLLDEANQNCFNYFHACKAWQEAKASGAKNELARLWAEVKNTRKDADYSYANLYRAAITYGMKNTIAVCSIGKMLDEAEAMTFGE